MAKWVPETGGAGVWVIDFAKARISVGTREEGWRGERVSPPCPHPHESRGTHLLRRFGVEAQLCRLGVVDLPAVEAVHTLLRRLTQTWERMLGAVAAGVPALCQTQAAPRQAQSQSKTAHETWQTNNKKGKMRCFCE